MQELLIYTPQITPRVTYTFQLFFDSIIRTPYSITTDEEAFRAYTGPKLNYSSTEFPNHNLQIIPYGLLTETDIKEQHINVWEWNNMKIFFQADKGSLPFDIFSAAFYLVSRYEEYFVYRPDEHTRFYHSTSLAFKNHFLKEPLVNFWAEELKKVILAIYNDTQFQKNTYTFIPTIDIDVAYAYLGRSILITIASYFKTLAKFQFKTLLEKKLVLLHLKRDPYDTYNFQGKIFRIYKLKPIYFFLAGKRGHNDNNISTKSSKFKNLVKKLSSFSEIGIHPSYQSDSNPEIVAMEIANVEQNIPKKITCSRQHFLKISLPETYRCLAKLGITDDYSMTYAGAAGFRASICTPFLFYDLKAENTLPVKVHSCAVMDGTLNEYLQLSIPDAIEISRELIDKVKKCGGEFIAIWHNHSISEQGHWKGWRVVFESMLESGFN